MTLAYTGDACDTTVATGGGGTRCAVLKTASCLYASSQSGSKSSKLETMDGEDGAKKALLPVHGQHNTHTPRRRFRCGGRGMPQSHRGYPAEWHRSYISLACVPRWSCKLIVPYLTEPQRRS